MLALRLLHPLLHAPWWQWEVAELGGLVTELQAGEATLASRRLLAIALARTGDVAGAETQARLVLESEAADPSMLFLKVLCVLHVLCVLCALCVLCVLVVHGTCAGWTRPCMLLLEIEIRTHACTCTLAGVGA